MFRLACQKAAGGLGQGLFRDGHCWLHSSAPLAAAFGSTMPSPTKLSAIVNMDKMLMRTPEQISSLWQEVRVVIARLFHQSIEWIGFCQKCMHC